MKVLYLVATTKRKNRENLTGAVVVFADAGMAVIVPSKLGSCCVA